MAGTPAGVPGIPLLTTKLFVPTARSDLVVRPRLLERLTDGAGARFTLLTAQAGAGKTTLLAAWLASRGSPVAWLSLDERDQDAHRFVRYVIAAFQTIAPGCGATALAWLEGSPSPVELVLTSLLNDVAALPRRTMLVLDDYHLVRSRAVHDALGFLLDHLPPAAQLVISTREDPPLALPRHPERGHDRAAARCHGRAARRGRRARDGHRTRCGPGGGRVGGREPGTGRPRLPRGRGGRPRPVGARPGSARAGR